HSLWRLDDCRIGFPSATLSIVSKLGLWPWAALECLQRAHVRRRRVGCNRCTMVCRSVIYVYDEAGNVIQVTKMPATTKKQKKLVRLISALSDMDESVQAANLMRGAPDLLYSHLFTSMVVAYGRPFTKNYGVGRIQGDYPAYPKDSDDADMPLRHSRLLDLRNKFLAHSSAEGTRVQIIPPEVANPLGAPPKPAFDFNIGKREFRDIRY